MFADLVKAAQHKYIKRVPKAGGKGYVYYYSEGSATSAKIKEHMKEKAAFRLTYKGAVGHFHITAVKGDIVSVKHDGSGVSVDLTRDELAALLLREHAKPEPAFTLEPPPNRKPRRRAKRKAPPLAAAPAPAPLQAPTPAPAPLPAPTPAPAPAAEPDEDSEEDDDEKITSFSELADIMADELRDQFPGLRIKTTLKTRDGYPRLYFSKVKRGTPVGYITLDHSGAVFDADLNYLSGSIQRAVSDIADRYNIDIDLDD